VTRQQDQGLSDTQQRVFRDHARWYVCERRLHCWEVIGEQPPFLRGDDIDDLVRVVRLYRSLKALQGVGDPPIRHSPHSIMSPAGRHYP